MIDLRFIDNNMPGVTLKGCVVAGSVNVTFTSAVGLKFASTPGTIPASLNAFVTFDKEELDCA